MAPHPKTNRAPTVDLERIEVIFERLSALATSFDSTATVNRRIAESFKGYVKELRAELDGEQLARPRVAAVVPADEPDELEDDGPPATIAAWMPSSSSSSSGGRELDGAAGALMNVLACFHPKSISRRELAHRAIYSPKSRHLGNVISAMRVGKFLEDDENRAHRATKIGLEAHGAPSPLLDARALVDAWRTRKLSGGAGTILQILSVSKHGTLTKREIAERSGYAASSRHFDNLLSELRSAELVEGKKTFHLAPWFVVEAT